MKRAIIKSTFAENHPKCNEVISATFQIRISIFKVLAQVGFEVIIGQYEIAQFFKGQYLHFNCNCLT